MRQCSKCGELKPEEDGFSNWKCEHRCKKCIQQKNKKYHQKHRGKEVERCRNYQQGHKEERAEYNRNYRLKQNNGKIPMHENKSCAAYLGVVIGERLVKHLFNDVTVMPYGNPKFDFICNRGKKIDVKIASTTLNHGKHPQWSFEIRKNTTADYFILVAFDNRINLNPLHMWMIPGKELNQKGKASISLSTLHKWDKWERDIKDAQICCTEMKNKVGDIID